MKKHPWMNRKEPTLEDAQQFMKDNPDEEEFIQTHFQGRLTQDGYDDNSLDLQYYWRSMKRIIDSLTIKQ